jgi:hypothetical protein
MTDPFNRDRYGRPLIAPDGDEHADPLPYQRVSTFAGLLDDKGGLLAWQAWMAVRGSLTGQGRDLAAVAAEYDRAPRDLINQLVELGGGHQARTKGSMRHELVEWRLTGRALPDMPPDARAELEAVASAVERLGTLIGTEVPIVNDEYRVAGSCDYLIQGRDGSPIVADLKTGKTVMPGVAVQLVAYARGRRWVDGQRADWVAWAPPRLVAVHAPQDRPGDVRVMEVTDLQAAKEAAELAVTVRNHRKRKDWWTRHD